MTKFIGSLGTANVTSVVMKVNIRKVANRMGNCEVDMSDQIKIFEPFKAQVPDDFREKMIQFWMDEDGFETKEEALSFYCGEAFEQLCLRLPRNVCDFKPDLGYSDKDGIYCFEIEDNNFVIPVRILMDIQLMK